MAGYSENLPLKATIAAAIAASILLALDLKGLLDVGAIAPYIRSALIVSSVVFSVMAMVGIIDALSEPVREKRRQSGLILRRAVRRKEEEELLAVRRIQTIASLDHLSKEETRYVADSLREGSPTFYTYANSPPVGMLLGKGLVWTTGGSYNQE
jgi:hypothetical protein